MFSYFTATYPETGPR